MRLIGVALVMGMWGGLFWVGNSWVATLFIKVPIKFLWIGTAVSFGLTFAIGLLATVLINDPHRNRRESILRAYRSTQGPKL